MTRQISYVEAICEAHTQLLETDPRVFVFGQGLWSPWYAGASLKDLDKKFGKDRIIDTPVSENAVTGAAIGAAIAGMRPIVFHPRMDFMLLAVDPIVNQAANWAYIFGGKSNVPVVIRAVINRGGEQGAQHAQAVQSFFMHVPGIKVVMPATAYDAKGLLIAAVRDGNPVMYIDDRWLYEEMSEVPEEIYEVPIGKAVTRRRGKDLTIVGLSYMASEAVKSAAVLAAQGIDAEVIDLRSAKPWDRSHVLESVAKTGRVIIADAAWKTCGASAEIAAAIAEEIPQKLKEPVIRVTLPDTPAPSARTMEKTYFINAGHITQAALKLLKRSENVLQSSVR